MDTIDRFWRSNWTGFGLGVIFVAGLTFVGWDMLTKPSREPISVSEIMIESGYGTGKPCSTNPQRTCITLRQY